MWQFIIIIKIKLRDELCFGGKVKWYELLWKIAWQFLRRLIRELPYDLVIPLLSIYP